MLDPIPGYCAKQAIESLSLISNFKKGNPLDLPCSFYRMRL